MARIGRGGKFHGEPNDRHTIPTMIELQTGNLDQKFSLITEYWSPHIVATLNGQQVLLAKFQGEFVWHSHAQEDEMFYVYKGEFTMEFRDKNIGLKQGDFLVVPKGVEHRPVADAEVCVALFEPLTTKQTGEVFSERTKHDYPRI